MGLFSTLPSLHFFLIFLFFISHFFHDLRFSLYLSIKLILVLSFSSFSSSDVIVIRRSSVGCYCNSNLAVHTPGVAQRQSAGLIILRSLVRTQPPVFFQFSRFAEVARHSFSDVKRSNNLLYRCGAAASAQGS